MEQLRIDNLAVARTTTPEERLQQALEVMAAGIELKRSNLSRRFPDESEREIEERLMRWLARQDD